MLGCQVMNKHVRRCLAKTTLYEKMKIRKRPHQTQHFVVAGKKAQDVVQSFHVKEVADKLGISVGCSLQRIGNKLFVEKEGEDQKQHGKLDQKEYQHWVEAGKSWNLKYKHLILK